METLGIGQVLGTDIQAAEYFAGIGLARIGLEQAGIEVAWSNDISSKKEAMFRGHFGQDEPRHRFHLGDLRDVRPSSMPEKIDLAWASFPCTDLSLAGTRGGLSRQSGASSTFWHFIKNLSQLGARRPRVVALENVTGFVSSRAGRDISAAIRALNGLGYSIDVLSIDARRFLPQSRPRLFLVGDMDPPQDDPASSEIRPSWLDGIFSDPTLRTHRATVATPPPLRTSGFSAIADRLADDDSRWWDKNRTTAFKTSLTDLQEERLSLLMTEPSISFRSAYRRMRNGEPRWEIRADDIAGCLRTARGGSSRQAVVMAGSGSFKVRWMTPAEYASLMGVPNYVLDGLSANTAYSGFGDAVCVPVVRWLAENYLVPRLDVLRDRSAELLEVSA